MKNPPPPEEEETAGYHGRFSVALSRMLARLRMQDVPHIQRIIVTVVGGTVLILGLALIVLPGQLLVIVAGLAILGTEYAWARSLLRKGRQLAGKALSQTQRIATRRHGVPAAAANPEPANRGGSAVSQTSSEVVDDWSQ